MWLLLLMACSPPSFAKESTLSYTDMNSVQAERNLEKISSQNPAKLAENDLAEWVRARFAWIALMRLEGKDKEAVVLFEGCGTYCENQGPSLEWGALKKWGCSRSPGSLPCKAEEKTEKTKAPKPPH